MLEIYGSTETGALAMRRTARETRWSPLDGVSLDPVDGATLGRGAHFASPVQLLDEIVVEANGTFTLLGRQADLIKIAGRRASLAGLNLLLQDLPGLDDGVFYLPATGNPTERLCLIYSRPAARARGGPALAAGAARSGLPAARLHPARPAAAQRDRQAAPAFARPRVFELASGSAAAARQAIGGFARARGGVSRFPTGSISPRTSPDR